MALNTSRPAYGQMQIAYDAECKVDGNMEALANKCDAETLLRQLAATLSGTYDIVPNNYFLPTGCKLNAVGGGNSYILK